jgi:spore maturation protein CgeB
MKGDSMKILFFGLSLSSSWGNGHATTYRALIAALAARGHRIIFLEREQPWYAEHRDLREAAYCELRFYRSLAQVRRWGSEIADADAVIIGSFVPQGTAVAQFVQETARGIVAFYDIDTPVTLEKLRHGSCEYLSGSLVAGFDLYLSFTGGPTLSYIEDVLGAATAKPLYCSVDPRAHRPTRAPRRWDLGYLGTYSADRQPALETLLLEPARRAPHLAFVVVGSLYPRNIDWPANVQRIDHLPPGEHADFYSSLGWALNITRPDMIRAGYSPSVRLFEAAACGTPIISDNWTGLEDFFRADREILVARSSEDVISALASSERVRRAIGASGQRRVLAEHTAAHRAADLGRYLQEASTTALRTPVKLRAGVKVTSLDPNAAPARIGDQGAS